MNVWEIRFNLTAAIQCLLRHFPHSHECQPDGMVARDDQVQRITKVSWVHPLGTTTVERIHKLYPAAVKIFQSAAVEQPTIDTTNTAMAIVWCSLRKTTVPFVTITNPPFFSSANDEMHFLKPTVQLVRKLLPQVRL